MGNQNKPPHKSEISKSQIQNCDCSRAFDESSIRICENHKTCKDCALSSLTMKMCKICKITLRSEQVEMIRKKYTDQCKQCNENKTHFEKLKCGCVVCTDCQSDSKNKNKCLACDQVLKEKPCTNSSFCNICYEPIELYSKIDLDCKHFFHLKCLVYQIDFLISDISSSLYSGGGIACPECQILISEDLLPRIMNDEQIKKLTLILNPDIIECSQCKCYFIPETKNFFCSCGNNFCIRCKRKPENCECDKNDEFEITDEMSCCPGCKTPYYKDDNCDHVKCQTNGCRVEFCFKCSAYRDPTIKHGNHYHRPSCPFYSNYSGNDIYKTDCSRCRYFGRVCDRPIDLRHRGIFEEGET